MFLRRTPDKFAGNLPAHDIFSGSAKPVHVNLDNPDLLVFEALNWREMASASVPLQHRLISKAFCSSTLMNGEIGPATVWWIRQTAR